MAEPGGRPSRPPMGTRRENPRRRLEREEGERNPGDERRRQRRERRETLSPAEQLLIRLRASKEKREREAEAKAEQYEDVRAERRSSSTPEERDARLRSRIQEGLEAKRTPETPRERRRRQRLEEGGGPSTAEDRPRRRRRRRTEDSMQGAEQPRRRSGRAEGPSGQRPEERPRRLTREERRDAGQLRTYERPVREQPAEIFDIEDFQEEPQGPTPEEQANEAYPMEPEKGMKIEVKGYRDKQQIVAVEDGYVYYLDQSDFNRMDASSGSYTSPKGEANSLQKKMLLQDFETMQRRKRRRLTEKIKRQRAAG